VAAQQREKLNRVVWVDPDRMSGAPSFTGTRVPVQMLLDHLQHGDTIDDFLEGAPWVSRRHAELFLELAGQQLVERVSFLVSLSRRNHYHDRRVLSACSRMAVRFGL
jgi:uncharacterized protein (DUF433 family)